MKKINLIMIMTLCLCAVGCKKTPEINKFQLLGIWETEWEDMLDGDLDEMSVKELLYFDVDGTFQQFFSGTVTFDDWENETDVSYSVGIGGTWSINKPDEIVLKYNISQIGVDIGKSSIEADHTDAAIGLLMGDWGSFLSGVMDSNQTDKLNQKVEAEVEKQITKYFKDMFREINKDKEALTDVVIDDDIMSAEINHGFMGRDVVYNRIVQDVLDDEPQDYVYD